MIDWIQYMDSAIVLWVQEHLRSNINDALIPWLRHAWFWAPVYAFLFYFTVSRMGKQGISWCVFFILVFALGDSFSAQVLKPFFHRLRPCNNPDLIPYFLNMPIHCGTGFSFPSSHATNHAALSTFIIMTLKHRYPRVYIPAVLWAVLVCFGQLYVGVHYLSDLLAGALLGTLIGFGLSALYNKGWGT